jgi:hypothetical protein
MQRSLNVMPQASLLLLEKAASKIAKILIPTKSGQDDMVFTSRFLR